MFDDNKNKKPAAGNAGQKTNEPAKTGEPPAGLPTATGSANGSSAQKPAAPSQPAPAPPPPAPAAPVQGNAAVKPTKPPAGQPLAQNAPQSPKPAAGKGAAPPPVQPPTPKAGKKPPVHGRKRGKGLKIFLGVILVVVIVGAAIYLAYAFIIQPPQEGPLTSVPEEGVATSEESNQQPEEEPQEQPEEEPEEEVMDSDGDGLTDSEERQAGTDPTSTDTDQDGLGDREEVEVYGTDPLDPDTDGDGFLDGEEVANGFNPNGEGRLFEVPK